jgi:UrcA family protein
MTKFRITLAGAAAALALAAVPAVAKDVTYNPYYTPAATAPVTYTTAEGDIVVTPYTREHIRRSPLGGRDERVSMSARVATHDLNLRYDGDVRELNRRVTFTARDLCNELERVARDTITSDRECVRGAIRSAQPQIDAAVHRARYY